MHGSDYDIRLFKMGHNFVPNAIFDTMLAARIVGRTQFGLSRLVSEILGVELEKTSQKANWAKRPLTDRMREYALNDTRHLKSLVDALASELDESGRAAWHKQECDRLIRDNSTIQEPDPDKIWRIKGSAKLDPIELSVLKGLWLWREKEARRRNRPPYFVLSPDAMVKLSEEATQEGDIAKWLPRRIPDYRQREIQKCIKSFKSMPNGEWPERHKSPPRKHITPPQKKRFEEIQKKRNKEAAYLAIDPTIIASRATMVRLACEAEGVFDDVLPWQQEVLGIC
jgi:ribonuclease D